MKVHLVAKRVVIELTTLTAEGHKHYNQLQYIQNVACLQLTIIKGTSTTKALVIMCSYLEKHGMIVITPHLVA